MNFPISDAHPSELDSSDQLKSLKEDFNKNHLPRLNKKLAKEDRIATGL